jgi:hypothetical protein
MSSAIFNPLKALEWARLHFYIEWTRPDTVRVNVTLVGERIEIDHIEDGHLEISHFRGDAFRGRRRGTAAIFSPNQ